MEPTSHGGGGRYHSILQAAALVVREEGFSALWRGHVPAQCLTILYGAGQVCLSDCLGVGVYLWDCLGVGVCLWNYLGVGVCLWDYLEVGVCLWDYLEVGVCPWECLGVCVCLWECLGVCVFVCACVCPCECLLCKIIKFNFSCSLSLCHSLGLPFIFFLCLLLYHKIVY